MPRPRSKDELISHASESFKLLIDTISAIPESSRMREFKIPTMNRNVRDVLGHLHHWHLMFLNWYETGLSGEKPEMPAPGYTWRTVPALNRMILETYNDADLSEMVEHLRESHQKVMAIIEQHSDDELFERKRFKWTGSTSLGAYAVSATSSHYAWALKLIKKGLAS